MTPAEREERILSLKRTVHSNCARAVRIHNLSKFQDDIFQSAWVAAIQAVDSFDPTRGVSLHAFADHRVKGAILDYFRACDPLKRDHRKKVQSGEAPPPEHFQIHPDLGLAGTFPQIPQAEDRMECRQLLALANLNHARRVVIEGYFFNDRKLQDIGRDLGINESRACQLKNSALAKLRAAAA